MSGSLLAGNRYVVSFRPDVTHALSDGSMQLMCSSHGSYYAIAVTADGKRIVQTGITEKAGFPRVAVPGLLLQAAAIVTAQRFLSDINQQLAKIGEAVEFIKRYLEAERIGTVQASYERLVEILAAMNAGEWDLDDSRRWILALDNLDFECSRIVKAGLAQRQDHLEMAGILDLGRIRIKKGEVDKAVRNSNDFEAHFGLCASPLYVRAAAENERANGLKLLIEVAQDGSVDVGQVT